MVEAGTKNLNVKFRMLQVRINLNLWKVKVEI